MSEDSSEKSLAIEEQWADSIQKTGSLASAMAFLSRLLEGNPNISFNLSLHGGAHHLPYRPGNRMAEEGTATITLGLRDGEALIFGTGPAGRGPLIVARVNVGAGIHVQLIPFEQYAGDAEGKFSCIIPWHPEQQRSVQIPSPQYSAEMLFNQAVADICEIFGQFIPKPKS